MILFPVWLPSGQPPRLPRRDPAPVYCWNFTAGASAAPGLVRSKYSRSP